MSSSCCGVCEGGAVFWKEGSRQGAETGCHTRFPLRTGERGAVASPAASSTSCPTVLDRTGWPGPRVQQLTSLAARKSLYAPFLDLWGHQRACTMKRPVSRQWWGSIWFRCASSHAASPGCFSTPPLSHAHSHREPGEGRWIRDRVVMIRGEAANSLQYVCYSMVPTSYGKSPYRWYLDGAVLLILKSCLPFWLFEYL